MSRTLFWYVMRDLLRIFLMASIVLGGIMSFGGILKPLTQYGLSGTQLGRMLLYFLPAMQTYSLPIAALFATTVVYGRLSADNELTACRGGGVSYLAMAVPAFVLGLGLSLLSLLSLSFIVPHFTLKVEKVVFASLAEMVQKNIQRSHKLKPPGMGYTIFAESAEVLPKPSDRPDDELVVLRSPMFCFYEEDPKTKINEPAEVYTAREAQVRIHQGEDQVEFWARLLGGVKIPRDFVQTSTGGIEATLIGPIPLPSPIRENTKFMNIQQLKELDRHPLRSHEIRRLYGQITRQEQEQQFLESIVRKLNADGEFLFQSGREENMRLVLSRGAAVTVKDSSRMAVASTGTERQVRIVHERFGQVRSTESARQLKLHVQADQENKQMRLEFDLIGVTLDTEEGRPGRQSLIRPFTVPMSGEQVSIQKRTPGEYLRTVRSPEAMRLRRKLEALSSGIKSESHGRAAFALSCMILVMVGCALGMMFKTGNYLNAFALSVIPALLCIALTVTGQHVIEANANNLGMGLAIIWSGNVLVLGLAVGLLGRLQKQ